MCAPDKIRFFNFQETNRVSHVSYQTRIFHTYTRNRAQRGLVDAKISTEINAPLQQQRRPRFKIGRLGLRGGANLALAVDEVCLGGPETPIRARKRVRISRDIRDLRGRSSWSRKEALIGNRLLRPARRSDFGLGLRSSVLRRSGNTNPRGEKLCRCRNISAANQNNTKKSVHPYFLIQGSTILSGWFLLQEPI